MDAIGRVRDVIAANPFLTAEGDSAAADAIDIVVPIYDALADLVNCLASVARASRSPFRLILVNDGSTDAEVSRFLAEISQRIAGVVVIDRARNLGFAHSVNDGIALSRTRDVVLLNSDTIVTANWLKKLVAASRRHSRTATVTPLTNNGTLCSVPNPFEENEIPAGHDIDSFAALIETASLRIYPEVPTGVGFCMLMTRRALETVGALDAETFGRGYGEENDFCQRAIRAGFVNLIADDTFVYHKGRSSFGAAGHALSNAHLSRLSSMHPAYTSAVDRTVRDHPLKEFHERLRERLAAGLGQPAATGVRVLHVLHQGGGTERHARDLASVRDPRVQSYVLTSDGRRLTVDRYDAGRCVASMRFPLMAPIDVAGTLFDAAYRKTVSTICWALNVNLIHVHHLMHNTLDIADVAGERGIPYVVTLHDYYVMCPSYTLLDAEGNPCGDCRGGTAGHSAAACMAQFGKPSSHLEVHQRLMHDFLAGAARVFVPSGAAKEVIAERFADVADKIAVIEHGHAWPSTAIRSRGPRSQPANGGPRPLNVATIGGLDTHKGLRVLRDLLRANRNPLITFHVYGTSSDPDVASDIGVDRTVDGSRFTYHGPYESTEIVGKLVNDGIDVGLQPAIWPETFSYTLSEFVAAGVPVITGNLGAQGERVRRFNLGWIAPDVRDSSAILGLLQQLAEHPEAVRDKADSMNREGALRPIEPMWCEYLAVYRALTKNPTTSAARANGGAPDKVYLSYLARQLEATAVAHARSIEAGARTQAELDWFRERMRSPRHRLAEAAANVLQRVPFVWPAIAAITDFTLRRQNRRNR